MVSWLGGGGSSARRRCFGGTYNKLTILRIRHITWKKEEGNTQKDYIKNNLINNIIYFVRS